MSEQDKTEHNIINSMEAGFYDNDQLSLVVEKLKWLENFNAKHNELIWSGRPANEDLLQLSGSRLIVMGQAEEALMSASSEIGSMELDDEQELAQNFLTTEYFAYLGLVTSFKRYKSAHIYKAKASDLLRKVISLEADVPIIAFADNSGPKAGVVDTAPEITIDEAKSGPQLPHDDSGITINGQVWLKRPKDGNLGMCTHKPFNFDIRTLVGMRVGSADINSYISLINSKYGDRGVTFIDDVLRLSEYYSPGPDRTDPLRGELLVTNTP